MMFTAMAYRSRSKRQPSEADLDALLFDARAFNAHSGVTGVLLVADGRFLQYLEGPGEGLAAVLARVRSSRMHDHFELLFEAAISRRLFQTWHMALLRVPDSVFLRIAEADWHAELDARSAVIGESAGMRELMAAWRHPVDLGPAQTLGVSTSPHPMQLIRPTTEHLPSYIDALERGWSADNVRASVAAQEELARIRESPEQFLAGLEDKEAKGAPVTLPDGSSVRRIPGFRRWIWDGEFAGSIGLRWQPGTTDLPPHCLGHVGYAVVPWKQGRGYATAALKLMLQEAASIGLPFVEITTDPENVASQRVIEAAGGRLHERFLKPPQFGSKPGLRYRVQLA